MGGSDSKEEPPEDELQKTRTWKQDADWQKRYQQLGKGPGVVGGLPAMAGKRFTDPHDEPFVIIPSRYPPDWYPPETGGDGIGDGGAPNQNGSNARAKAGAKAGAAGQGQGQPQVASRAGNGSYPAPPGYARENWMQNDPRVQNFYKSNGRMMYGERGFAGPGPLRGLNPSGQHYGDYYLTKAPGIDK